MRYLLRLAYDGQPFAGWQSQPGGMTIQDLVEKAFLLAKIPPVRVHSSGRTDAGVHALGQTAHFDVPQGFEHLKPEIWPRMLNRYLPPQIRVMDCVQVDERFHARFDALGKEYHYRLYTSLPLPPHQHGRMWQIHAHFDPALMQSALDSYVGTHDFHRLSAYRHDGSDQDDTIRTIHRAQLELEDGDSESYGWRVTFVGNGFLYKMVRLLTGAAVKIALGKEPISQLQDYLENPRKGNKCHHCAPADGLYLAKVLYNESLFKI